MQIRLTEAEVARAVQQYIATKTHVAVDALKVTMIWRAKAALVQVPAIPTLTDKA
jgi:hypothetical protein